MDRDEFRRLLARCTAECLTLSRQYLLDDLPDDVFYWLYPNQSHDKLPLDDDVVVHPNDTLATPEAHHELALDGAVDFLWRNGRIPEWVDIMVSDISDNRTCVELLCCGRFTASRHRWRYSKAGRGPFGVKGPYLPVGFDSEHPTRFQLRRGGAAGTHPPRSQKS